MKNISCVVYASSLTSVVHMNNVIFGKRAWPMPSNRFMIAFDLSFTA